MSRLSMTITIILAWSALLLAQQFPDSCPQGKTAHFPSTTATAIDKLCGISGTPNPKQPGDTPQNEAKNNFCIDATAKAEPIHLSDVKSLQGKAAAEEKKRKLVAGEPPKDRSFLESLGEGHLVVFEGYVFEARQECGETVNCGDGPPNVNASHDIHIALLEEPRKTPHKVPPGDKKAKAAQDAEECTGFVAEMIPHHRLPEWTACNVEAVSESGLRVRITGQQFFDGSHVPCKNGVPQGSNPKRVSLWEIHPIYTFEVCPKGDCAGGGWQPLEQYAAGQTDCKDRDCTKKSKSKKSKSGK